MQELTQRARNLADVSPGAPTGPDQATHTYFSSGPGFFARDKQSYLCLAHILLLPCICQGHDLS